VHGVCGGCSATSVTGSVSIVNLDDPVDIEPLLRSYIIRRLSDVPDGPIKDRLLGSINLVDNYTTGLVAEVIVAESCGGELVGEGYGTHDVDLDGLRIEVKSSALVQSWPQEEPSIPSYDIEKKHGYEDPTSIERRNDVYVFAHHRGGKPDDPAEWTFYVVPTARINERFSDQKTIRLSVVIDSLDPEVVDAAGLRAALEQCRSL